MASTRGPDEHITATRDGDNMPIQIYGHHGADVQIQSASGSSVDFTVEVGHFYQLTSNVSNDDTGVEIPKGTQVFIFHFDIIPFTFKVLVGQFANNAKSGLITALRGGSAGTVVFTLRELL